MFLLCLSSIGVYGSWIKGLVLEIEIFVLYRLYFGLLKVNLDLFIFIIIL